LHEGDSVTNSRPKVSRSEVSDRDWMETAWVLRYELSDIFEQIVIALRDRMIHRIEELEEPEATGTQPGKVASHAEEESAL
ncbi:MAG: hypothetical protein WBM25_12120, partial [Azonexus sp.]